MFPPRVKTRNQSFLQVCIAVFSNYAHLTLIILIDSDPSFDFDALGNVDFEGAIDNDPGKHVIDLFILLTNLSA